MPILDDNQKYRVALEDIEDLRPEETLMDAVSNHPKMEVPIDRSVFRAFFILVSLVLAVFMVTVFKLQVIHGTAFFNIVKNTNAGSLYSVPIRGIIYDRKGQKLVDNIPAFKLVALTQELKKQKQNLDGIFNQLSNQIGIPSTQLKTDYTENIGRQVFTVKDGLTKEEVLKVKNLNLPGLYVIFDSVREYELGPAAAHVVGYTSKVLPTDVKNDGYYKPTDRIGRYGIEAKYEKILRGDHHLVSLNEEQASIDVARAGDSLTLNIDSDIQKKLYEAMMAVGVGRGAAIAQDPRTGAVLGMVSMPSFDSNVFESGDDTKIQRILDDRSRPLFDRSVSGRYSPGSTIKPLLAGAGLTEGVVTPHTTIEANGSISIKSIYDPNVVYTFKDWKVHGLTDLRKSIADSVDIYYYALGGGYGPIKGLGADRVVNYFKTFLADTVLGIDTPGEVAGFVPSPEWKERVKKEPWFIGDTYNISIGQGDLSVTPLWLSTYVGSIAHNGTLMKPYLVQKVTDPDGKTVTENQPQVLAKIPFSPDTLRIVREGMRQTITSGTATMLNQLPVPVAAKTGTAQITGHGLNSLFIVFGPYENPTITVTILVEDIKNSQGMAIRVANHFLSWYFGKPLAPSPTP